MTRSPHVLWIPSYYPSECNPFFGVFFSEQASYLYERGIKIGIIYADMRPLSFILRPSNHHFQTSERVENGIPTIRLHGWDFFPRMPYLKKLAWLRHAKQLASLYIQKYGVPDLIHAHSVLYGGMAAYLVSKKYKIPYLITEHRGRYSCKLPKPDPFVKKVYEKASQVIAVSDPLRRGLMSNFGLKDVQLCPNPVDTTFFCLPKHAPEDPFRFLAITHLYPFKNLSLLLKAFAKMSSRKCLLEIIGDGPELRTLKKLSKDLKISKRVIFHGSLLRDEVKKRVQNCHTVILSSSFKSFGVALIEGFSCGKPAISTKCGGPEDLIIDGTGLLVENHHPDKLSKAMEEMCRRWHEYDPTFIRNYAMERFGIERFIKTTQEIYAKHTNTLQPI